MFQSLAMVTSLRCSMSGYWGWGEITLSTDTSDSLCWTPNRETWNEEFQTRDGNRKWSKHCTVCTVTIPTIYKGSTHNNYPPLLRYNKWMSTPQLRNIVTVQNLVLYHLISLYLCLLHCPYAPMPFIKSKLNVKVDHMLHSRMTSHSSFRQKLLHWKAALTE